jgi:4,5-dihydroxyphthalate decarboxylase
VKPEGINLDVNFLAPSETFYRMLKFDEFDISEMSLSSYLIARSQGRAWTAIPVFPFRNLFHLSIYSRAEAGIEEPRDVEEKRFGLTEYQVTAAVWTRGVLQEDFGVDLTKVNWLVERTPEMSHGGVTGFRPPEGITIEQIPADKSLQSLIDKDLLDAVLPDPYPGIPSRLNRTEETELQRSPKMKRLFHNPRAEMARYYGRHGMLHMNHTIVVQNSALETHPWMAMSLFNAFQQAKEYSFEHLDHLRRSALVLAGAYLDEERALLGDDPFPYGFLANRTALEKLVGYSKDQGFTDTKPVLEELFAEETLST